MVRETRFDNSQHGQEKTKQSASKEEKEVQPLYVVLKRLEKSLRECVSDVRAAVNWRRKQRDNKGKSSCWRCGKAGHLRRECPPNTPPGSPRMLKKEEQSEEGQRKPPCRISGNGKKLMLGASAEMLSKEASPFALKTGNISATVDSLRVDGKIEGVPVNSS